MPVRCFVASRLFAALLLAVSLQARELRVEIASDHDASIQVFFGPTDLAFNERDSVTQPLPGDGEFHELHFRLPERGPLALRLDPGSTPGQVKLRRGAILDASGKILGALPNQVFQPQQQIGAAEPAGDHVAFTIPPGSNDPVLRLDDTWLTPLLDPGQHVTRGKFVVFFAIFGLCSLAGLGAALRWCLGGASGVPRWRIIAVAGMVVVALGIRLQLLAPRVSWAPYLDQFEGELATLVRPFQAGIFNWSGFNAPHNDHRIATTRIVALGTFLANGEWDNRVLVVLNCVLQGLAIAWFSALLLREFGFQRAWPVVAVTFLTVVWVNDWANIMTGFQLQFHLLLLASLIAISVLPHAPFFSRASWIGFAAGVFAAASMGSGFLALVAAGAGIVLRLWLDRRWSLRGIGLVGLAAAVVIYAWLTRAVFPALDPWHAKSVGQWLFALWTYGAWPFPAAWPWFATMWIPWVWLTGQVLRRRAASAFELFVVVAGFWLLLQAAALAYGRATYAPTMSSRYTGMLEWTGIVAATSVALALRRSGVRLRWQVAATCLASAAVAGMLAWQSHTFFAPQWEEFVTQTREHESRLGTFMRYDDPRVFSTVEFPHKPYPFDERLVYLLRNPNIRDALPAPLQRERYRFSDPVAFNAVRAGPLTHVARFLLRNSAFVIGVGVVLLVTAEWQRRRISRLAARPPGGNVDAAGQDREDRGGRARGRRPWIGRRPRALPDGRQ